jgi:hypothetical protein
MTSAEWDACADPHKLLNFLWANGRASRRKMRLFAVACCRRFWRLLTDERSRTAVEVAERCAEGWVTEQEREAAAWGARLAYRDAVAERQVSGFRHPELHAHVTTAAYFAAAEDAGHHEGVEGAKAMIAVCSLAARYKGSRFGGREGFWAVCCSVLRDLFGNPLRPVPALLPTVLVWNDRAVLKLAQAAYERRLLPSGHLDTGRLAVIADALEEAGCSDEAIFGHLRGPGPHVLGCHVLDLLLGKK